MTSPSLVHPRPAPDHPNGVQLGGLGTGRIELGANGRLTLAGVTNNWQRLLAGLDGAFFSLHVSAPDGRDSRFHLLQTETLDGHLAAAVAYSGLHPVAQVGYSLGDCPVRVDLTAFSPLVPHDLEASNVPGAVFRFRLVNAGAVPVCARLAFSWENLLGVGGAGRRGVALASNRTGNVQEPWRASPDAPTGGLRFRSRPDAAPANSHGDMVLAAVPPPGAHLWAYAFWNLLQDRPAVLAALAAGNETPSRFDGGPLAELEKTAREKQARPPSWDDPDPRFGGGRTAIEGVVHPAGVVGVTIDLAPGEAVEVPFVLAWHTPSHLTLDQPGMDHGHAYTARFSDAGAVARHLLVEWPRLLERTRELADRLAATDLPPWLAAKLVNDNTALTTNSIVTARGDLYTLEASPMMFGALGTLDQRLVSHPGYSLLYPELNRTELRAFAQLQAADGSLPHFNGNAHTALASERVEYGSTGWPDLSCSFIVQCYRDWRENGDDAFLAEMRPRIARAAAWLMAADRDGDGVPEGGSSWDIEHYPGCFIATATVWLATLRVLADLARREADVASQAAFDARFALASATVERTWNGAYYLKNHDPATGRTSDDVFLGQLAGEWIVRSLGLPGVLPAERVRAALATIYRLNGDRSRYRLMPIQVRPDGTLPPRKYAWHAWPQYTLVFVDCLALYHGLAEPALASVAAFDDVIVRQNRTPWATTLWYDARTGRPDFECYVGLDWYMNTPATWWVLAALHGVALDEPAATLTLGPVLPLGQRRARWPVITPRFWATLEVEDDAAGARRTRLVVERFFRGDTLHVRALRWRGRLSSASVAGRTTVLRAEDDHTRIELDAALSLRPRDVLELTTGGGVRTA